MPTDLEVLAPFGLPTADELAEARRIGQRRVDQAIAREHMDAGSLGAGMDLEDVPRSPRTTRGAVVVTVAVVLVVLVGGAVVVRRDGSTRGVSTGPVTTSSSALPSTSVTPPIGPAVTALDRVRFERLRLAFTIGGGTLLEQRSVEVGDPGATAAQRRRAALGGWATVMPVRVTRWAQRDVFTSLSRPADAWIVSFPRSAAPSGVDPVVLRPDAVTGPEVPLSPEEDVWIHVVLDGAAQRELATVSFREPVRGTYEGQWCHLSDPSCDPSRATGIALDPGQRWAVNLVMPVSWSPPDFGLLYFLSDPKQAPRGTVTLSLLEAPFDASQASNLGRSEHVVEIGGREAYLAGAGLTSADPTAAVWSCCKTPHLGIRLGPDLVLSLVGETVSHDDLVEIARDLVVFS